MKCAKAAFWNCTYMQTPTRMYWDGEQMLIYHGGGWIPEEPQPAYRPPDTCDGNRRRCVVGAPSPFRQAQCQAYEYMPALDIGMHGREWPVALPVCRGDLCKTA